MSFERLSKILQDKHGASAHQDGSKSPHNQVFEAFRSVSGRLMPEHLREGIYIAYFEDSILYLEADQPAILHESRLLEHRLLQEMQKELGEDAIKKIITRQKTRR